MRILFLSQLLPYPLDAGPKIRAHYVLRHLAEAGHDVTLLCFARQDDRQTDMAALQGLCRAIETVLLPRSRGRDLWDGFRSLLSSTPFLILRDQLPEMRQRVDHVLASRSFDALHADQLWMAPYALRCPTVPVKVLDQHNAVFKVPQRLARHQPNPWLRALVGVEASRLEAYERQTVTQFDRVVWVSKDDRDAVSARSSGPPARHDIIPIAVDPVEQQPIRRPSPFRVTFLGGLHWPPNAEGVRWFAERVWPTVAEAVPGAILTVIGKGSPGGLPRGGPTIEVAGYVPRLQPYLAETAAFVVPLLSGAGMRVKILDAWCWGLPVVSTSVGAEGIDVCDGENILLGDTETRLAECLVRVLRDGIVAKRLADGGRATVERTYDWRTVYKAWDRVYH